MPSVKWRGTGASSKQEMQSYSSTKYNSWFLGIGIDKYPNFAHLKNAEKDVNEISTLLLQKYDINPECLILLCNERATKKEIIIELDILLEAVGPDDKLIIYFAGHGILDERMGGHWLAFDAEEGNSSGNIDHMTIKKYVREIRARHLLLIIDSCFSGHIFRGQIIRNDKIEQEEAKRSRYAFCSGGFDQLVEDGAIGFNSPFCHSIIDFLENNTQNKIRISELAEHVVNEIRDQYKQTPEKSPLYNDGHEGGEYIFRRKETADPYPRAAPKSKGQTNIGISQGNFSLYEFKVLLKEYAKCLILPVATIVIFSIVLERVEDPFFDLQIVKQIPLALLSLVPFWAIQNSRVASNLAILTTLVFFSVLYYIFLYFYTSKDVMLLFQEHKLLLIIPIFYFLMISRVK